MSNAAALRDELQRIVGESGILPDAQIANYTIDGLTPKAVVLPASVWEIQDVLRFAAAQHLSVIPAGSGSKLQSGNSPEKVDIVLAMTHINEVVEYEPADLTVTVEAGIQLTALQEKLADNGQFLPLNPPYASRCTLGGIVAANASGYLRLRYGTARNLVLGLRVVHASGTVVKSGGKVVKNVAGYDVNKLYIGSFGTLGILTEMTLKLSPIPARQALLTAQFQDMQAAAKTGLSIVGSQTLPDFVNLLVNSEHAGPTLVAGFGGDAETVTWQLEQARRIMELNGAIGVKEVEGESFQKLNDAIRAFAESENESRTVIVQVNLKRTDIAEFAENVLTNNAEMLALLGSGVLYLKMEQVEGLAETLATLRERVVAAHGSLIIESAPPELKQQLDVWGPVAPRARNLMQQLKARFDERNLLNPGRFVSGI
ncbi:hypothetical protein C6495_08010 [Candidatus Poribacteria bacterium]|nr:MAG: hypothetical protein C6495_08010 [Candidatus Poribacteria bacterium]